MSEEIEAYSPVHVNVRCPHFFGYLSQRLKRDEIPPECLTCNLVLNCMLHAVKRDAHDEVMVEKAEAPEEVLFEKLLEDACEPHAAPFQKDCFVVDNLGMLYASWTSTVRIPRDALQLWGVRKVKEVEIETSEGKTAKCRVQLMEGSGEMVIQIPDKVQAALGIAKGDAVKVRPVK